MDDIFRNEETGTYVLGFPLLRTQFLFSGLWMSVISNEPNS